MATHPNPAPPIFRLPEYEWAFKSFLHEAIQTVGRAKDPLLSQIRVEERAEVGTSQVTSSEGEVVDLPPVEISLESGFTTDEMVAGDVGSVVAAINEVADQYIRQLMPQLFESIGRITDATGNSIDAGGRPFSPEILLDALEQIEWSFDENDEPIMPTLVMHPDMADRVANLPPLTPEQERAFEDLKERKRAEYRASRRHRRLS